jgi:predicted HTH transcriptional regulator
LPYSSLEAVVEKNKESYYLALRQTQGTLKTSTPDWQPWIMFFLRALQHQKKRLETKVEQETLLFMQLPNLSLQILQLIQSRGKATISDIATITNANRNTIKKHLETLVETNHIKKNGVGKGTWYSL